MKTYWVSLAGVGAVVTEAESEHWAIRKARKLAKLRGVKPDALAAWELPPPGDREEVRQLWKLPRDMVLRANDNTGSLQGTNVDISTFGRLPASLQKRLTDAGHEEPFEV